MIWVRLDHVALIVKNIDAVVKEYSVLLEALGWALPQVIWHQGKREGHSYRSATYVSQKGEVVFQFIESENPRDVKYMEKNGEGIHHLEFCTDDIEKLIQKLKEKNIPLEEGAPNSAEEMPWQKVITISPRKTHGVLIKITTSYAVKDGQWIRQTI